MPTYEVLLATIQNSERIIQDSNSWSGNLEELSLKNIFSRTFCTFRCWKLDPCFCRKSQCILYAQFCGPR